MMWDMHITWGMWNECGRCAGRVQRVCVSHNFRPGCPAENSSNFLLWGLLEKTSAAPPGADPNSGLLSLFREDSKARPHYDNYRGHLEVGLGVS